MYIPCLLMNPWFQFHDRPLHPLLPQPGEGHSPVELIEPKDPTQRAPRIPLPAGLATMGVGGVVGFLRAELANLGTSNAGLPGTTWL